MRPLAFTRPRPSLVYVSSVTPAGCAVAVSGPEWAPIVTLSLPAGHVNGGAQSGAAAIFRLRLPGAGTKLYTLTALGGASDPVPLLAFDISYGTPPVAASGLSAGIAMFGSSDFAAGPVNYGGLYGTTGVYASSERNNAALSSLVQVDSTSAPASSRILVNGETRGTGVWATINTTGWRENGGTQDAIATSSAAAFTSFYVAAVAYARANPLGAPETVSFTIRPIGMVFE